MATVEDFFRAEHFRGPGKSLICDWPAALNLEDGTTSPFDARHVVLEQIGMSYYELLLKSNDTITTVKILESMPHALRLNPQMFLPEAMQKNEIMARWHEQDIRRKLSHVPIAKKVTVFACARLEISTKERLVEHWRRFDLDLNIMDQNYVDANELKVRPYAFISHDWRDKETVARPIAERLHATLGTIWYDEFSLKVGDSLRESIEDGLRRSDRCVIILSKAFLQNQGWAKREFDAIYNREIVTKKKVMLPVWVDVNSQDLYAYSPELVGRLAVLWSSGIEKVTEELSKSLRQVRPVP